MPGRGVGCARGVGGVRGRGGVEQARKRGRAQKPKKNGGGGGQDQLRDQRSEEGPEGAGAVLSAVRPQ
jgi:hypothetical protein